MIVISSEKLDRVLNKIGQISMVQCFKLQVECKGLSIDSVENERKELPHSLQQILSSFKDVFVEPIGLPPQKVHDHSIPLKKGTQPFSCRPYRYDALQMDIIEKMTKEMLNSGVIQNTTSSFSSPMVLVRKKDNS